MTSATCPKCVAARGLAAQQSIAANLHTQLAFCQRYLELVTEARGPLCREHQSVAETK